MTASTEETNAARIARGLPEGLARTLRHEVGDFLQRVYAAVAILHARLPAEAQIEHDILTRLKVGAEGCKRLIDAVQDFLSPLPLFAESVDLAEAARELVVAARRRWPDLEIV